MLYNVFEAIAGLFYKITNVMVKGPNKNYHNLRILPYVLYTLGSPMTWERPTRKRKDSQFFFAAKKDDEGQLYKTFYTL